MRGHLAPDALARALLDNGGMDGLAELPDDPALLKRMLIERNTLIAQREAQLDQVKREAAAAITYTLNQWDALNRYVEQGCLNIDNTPPSGP